MSCVRCRVCGEALSKRTAITHSCIDGHLEGGVLQRALDRWVLLEYLQHSHMHIGKESTMIHPLWKFVRNHCFPRVIPEF